MGTRIAAYLGPFFDDEPLPAGLYGVSTFLSPDRFPITRRLNGGVLFDPARDALYAVDAVNDQLVALDATTHAELYRVDVAENVGRVQEQGNGVASMSDDGRYFFLSTPSGIRMFDLNPPSLACRAGNVNASAGPTADVLTINGSAGADAHRTVTVQPGQPLTVALAAPPGGPAAPSYFAWAWRSSATNAQTLVIDSSTLGCVVNPTPYHIGLLPQPIRCLRGSGLSPDGCAGVPMPTSPKAAPWSLTLPNGRPAPALLQIQGVIEDATATNGAGLSMTNAVFLRIR